MKTKIEMLKLADVIPTADNPRTLAPNDPKVAELAESIKANGLLQPVVCRPHPEQKGKWDLRAGFRRFLAHQALGLDEIMAIVRPMDDKTAMEITVLENLQRENLTPLEEARGIKALMDIGQDVRIIAGEIGKSAQWVLRRAKLTNLSPNLIKAVEDPDDDLYQTPAAFLDLIVRFDHQIQESIPGWKIRNAQSVSDLEKKLTDFTRRLKGAPWNLADEIRAAKAGACDQCIKRSSHQPGLFDEELDPEKIKANDTCLDVACWKEKMAAWLTGREIELRHEHPGLVLVTTETRDYEAPKGMNDVLQEWNFDKAKKGTSGAKPALVVHGPGQGKLIWITTEGHNSPNRGQREFGEDGKVVPLTLKEKREQLRKRRVAWVLEKLRDDLNKAHKHPAVTGVLKPENWLALGVVFGIHEKCTCTKDRWNMVDQLGKSASAELIDEFWDGLKPALSRALIVYSPGTISKEIEESGSRVAELLGCLFDNLLDEAAEEIPEPKSWAKEKDEEPKDEKDPKTDDPLCAKCQHPKSQHPDNGSCITCVCASFLPKMPKRKGNKIT